MAHCRSKVLRLLRLLKLFSPANSLQFFLNLLRAIRDINCDGWAADVVLTFYLNGQEAILQMQLFFRIILTIIVWSVIKILSSVTVLVLTISLKRNFIK